MKIKQDSIAGYLIEAANQLPISFLVSRNLSPRFNPCIMAYSPLGKPVELVVSISRRQSKAGPSKFTQYFVIMIF